MPIWAAVAIVAAAFGLRLLLRGPSFDRGDAVVLALFVVVLVITALGRRWVTSAERREQDEEAHPAATSGGRERDIDDEDEGPYSDRQLPQ